MFCFFILILTKRISVISFSQKYSIHQKTKNMKKLKVLTLGVLMFAISITVATAQISFKRQNPGHSCVKQHRGKTPNHRKTQSFSVGVLKSSAGHGGVRSDSGSGSIKSPLGGPKGEAFGNNNKSKPPPY